MERNLDRLQSEVFDVVVVGAGAHGACAAMEAAQRGLSVALIDKGDFSSATSHNSLKIVHGGIRYLQHVDFGRVRQSIVERRFWLHSAPHMVVPLEFWVPLQGWGTRGAAALWSGMRVHELFGWDRNRGLLADRSVPKGRIRGRKAVSQALGNIWGDEPPPAAVWSDGQMLDADRLILECIVAAEGSGAVIGNYVEALGLEQTRDSIVAGLEVRDALTMREFRIRANNVVLAAGPWTAKLADGMTRDRAVSKYARQIRNMNIVVPQKLAGRAIGIDSEQRSDAKVGKSNRLFFMTPWRNCSVIGTTHEPYDGDPNDYRVTEDEVSDFVSEVSEACPPLDLELSEVHYVYAGLTPSDGEDGSPARSRSSEVVDHGRLGGARGVYSIIGVKYTTARSLAERTVDLIGREWSKVQRSKSETSLLPGAEGLASIGSLLEEIRAEGPMDEDEVLDLAIAYGTRFRQVLQLVEGPPTRAAIFVARVKLAVREEMACKVADVALRRLDWMPRGYLDRKRGRAISRILASELGWTEDEERRNFSEFDQKLGDGVLTPSWPRQ